MECAVLFHRFQTTFMQAILILKILLTEGDIENHSEPISVKEIVFVVKNMPPSILYLKNKNYIRPLKFEHKFPSNINGSPHLIHILENTKRKKL